MIDVLVIGRSLSALAAALDLAEVGLRVTVLGAAEADVEPDADLETPDLDHEGTVAELLSRVAEALPGSHAGEAEGLLPHEVPPSAPVLLGSTGWSAQPEPNVWGIPAVPLAAETIALIGNGGAMRAYRDRIAPLLTVGKTRSIGVLVRKRLGRRLQEAMVEPQLRERYGAIADEVEVDIAAPGLNESLTRAGSLSAAASVYSDRHVRRETRIWPRAGWGEFRVALLERLALYGAEFAEGALEGISPGDEETWRVSVEGGGELHARALVVNCPTAAGSVPFDGRLDGILPSALRLHASIGIEGPEELSAFDTALRTVEGWSLRLTRGERGEWKATLTSPRVDCGLPGIAEELADTALLDLLLEGAGLRPSPDAEWRLRHRAAPYVAVAERDAAQEAIEQFVQGQPTVLPVGRALHGDDLSAALLAAREGAVELRRRLLGLSE